MSKGIRKPAKSTAALPADYAPLLAEIKARVQSARIKAGLAANRELLTLYWDIGRLILERQKREGWGAKVIDRLALDLQRAFPRMSGFSRTNLLYMRAFAEAWRETVIVQRPAAQLAKAKRSPAVTDSTTASAGIVQQPVGQLAGSIVHPSGAQFPTLPPEPLMSLPWGHNVTLLDKLSSSEDRLWYAAKAVEHGWSRNVLALQIEAGLHLRQGKAVTNFKTTLPPAQSDLAQGITKDPYLFDFLMLRDDANERAVEDGLLAHVEKFLLELGAGFALVGRQAHLEVGDRDFYLDLLFYHLKLRCFVVLGLKAREFTPEAAGKMDFYLSAVDDHRRRARCRPPPHLHARGLPNEVLGDIRADTSLAVSPRSGTWRARAAGLAMKRVSIDGWPRVYPRHRHLHPSAARAPGGGRAGREAQSGRSRGIGDHALRVALRCRALPACMENKRKRQSPPPLGEFGDPSFYRGDVVLCLDHPRLAGGRRTSHWPDGYPDRGHGSRKQPAAGDQQSRRISTRSPPVLFDVVRRVLNTGRLHSHEKTAPRQAREKAVFSSGRLSDWL